MVSIWDQSPTTWNGSLWKFVTQQYQIEVIYSFVRVAYIHCARVISVEWLVEWRGPDRETGKS